MRRLLVAACAAAAGLAVAAPAAAAPPSYRVTLEPREVLFGDTVTAQVEVFLDPAAVPPASVRVHTDFRPYTARGATVSRGRTGGVERFVYRYRLDCLEQKCLPGGPSRRVQFRPVRISWAGGGTTIFWPPLELASRVEPRDVRRPSLRSDVIRQPAFTFGIAPGLLTALLALAAAALFACPALLLARLGARGWRRWRTSRLERLTPLERALELLRLASRGRTNERRALERLARELGGHQLGEDARRLAWSRPAPASDDMESLRERIEEKRA